ncbi:unnamed protein product [Prorocentrum cordatum]|uniref:Uncharacterized protein n=1 Tax=Prorocentrum cordatum TaxID=2364126 RepID=A0ABN9XLK0_9DINO|nr:unnamed protein product [Polarella glacialis]
MKGLLVACMFAIGWHLCACKSDEQEYQTQMGRHVGFRKNEIVFNLRATCPSITSFDAHQLSSFIDANEQFDDTLHVELAEQSGKIILHGGGCDGENWSIKYPKKDSMDSAQFAADLFKVLKSEIQEQKDSHFPIRRITQKAVQKYFKDFPQQDGSHLTTKSFKDKWFRLKPDAKMRFAKGVNDEFGSRFKSFYTFLKAHHIDVQGLIETGWLPLQLQEAFFVHYVCQVAPEEERSEWKDQFYEGAGQILSHATVWTAGWMKKHIERRSPYHTKYGDL